MTMVRPLSDDVCSRDEGDKRDGQNPEPYVSSRDLPWVGDEQNDEQCSLQRGDERTSPKPPNAPLRKYELQTYGHQDCRECLPPRLAMRRDPPGHLIISIALRRVVHGATLSAENGRIQGRGRDSPETH